MAADRENVFVYGTLRRGGSHHWRMEGADFIASGTVAGRMYRFDWYPGLVLGGEGEVKGEVFAVGAEQLAALDVFEGLSAGEIEGSEYRRVKTPVTTADGTLTAWAWEWVGPVDESMRIAGGDWLAVA